MKRFFLSVVVLFAMFCSSAFATQIFYCNGTYTDAPCGKQVKVFDDRPTCDDRVRATERAYEDKLAVLSHEYNQREFELTKSYIQAPRINQNTTVTTIGGGASAGASAQGGRAISGSSSNSNAGASSNSSADRINRSFNRTK